MSSPLVHPLEPRLLFIAQPPTVEETYLVELINRARLNPTVEATLQGIALTEGLTAGAIASTPKQPVAINTFLTNAASLHAEFMRVFGQVTLVGANGSLPRDRVLAAGYVFTGGTTSSGSAEDVAALPGAGAAAAATQAELDLIHRALFVDANTTNRINRVNMMAENWTEVGAGVRTGQFGPNTNPNPGGPPGPGTQASAVVATEDFAFSSGNANGDNFLTGVAFNDADGDNFYDIGEGVGNITITARRLGDNRVFTTTAFASGAYSLRLLPGTYDVIGSSAALGGSVRYSAITIGGRNVKRDFRSQDATTPPPGPGGSVPNTPPPILFQGDLAGRVFVDQNGNGRRDRRTDNEVIPNVRVFVDANKNGLLDSNEAFGVVQEDGSWRITGQSAGINRVGVEPPSGYRVSVPDEGFREVGVFSSRQTRVKDFLITRRTIIAGTVYRDDNNNATEDAGEKGLRNWRVFIDLNNDGVWQRETEPAKKTDRQGKYAFRDLAAATYTVRVIPKVGYLQTEPANGGFYTVTLPFDGLGSTDIDFGERLLG